MSAPGKFITLEGVDGAGKSSHVEFIADAMRAKGRHVIVTREPGGTDTSEALREVVLGHPMEPVSETLLLLAARAEHVAKVIRPSLQAGTWVICDRFIDATIAYQGAGKGVSTQLIRTLSDSAHPGLMPDRTLVFDCSYEVSRQRLQAAGRKLDRFEREERAFFERVRSAYLESAGSEPARIRVIDASDDMATIRQSVSKHLLDL